MAQSCHVTHMTLSCHTHSWIMPQEWWVISRTWLSRGCSMPQSSIQQPQTSAAVASSDVCCSWCCVLQGASLLHTKRVPEFMSYQLAMSHTWMRHVAHINESCHTHEWVTVAWVDSLVWEALKVGISHTCITRCAQPTKLESSVGVSTLILIKRWGATSTWRSTVWCSVLRCVAVKYSQYVKCGGHLLHRRSTSSK